MAQPAQTVITSMIPPDLTRRYKYYEYAFQFVDAGAPTYPAGGIVVDLTTVINPGWPRGKWSRPVIPANNEIEEIILPNGYTLTLQQGAANPTMKNFVIRIWTAPGTELGTGAGIPAALFAALLANAPQIVFQLRTRNFQ